PTISKRPVAAELEHQPAHLQLLSTGRLHFDKHDLAAGGHYSYRHSQRCRPDRVRRSAGSPHSRHVPPGQYGEVRPGGPGGDLDQSSTVKPGSAEVLSPSSSSSSS